MHFKTVRAFFWHFDSLCLPQTSIWQNTERSMTSLARMDEVLPGIPVAHVDQSTVEHWEYEQFWTAWYSSGVHGTGAPFEKKNNNRYNNDDPAVDGVDTEVHLLQNILGCS